MAKARSLTVYLIKRSQVDPQNLVVPDLAIKKYTIPSPSGIEWTLFVRKNPPKPPRWADFFVPHVMPDEFGLTGSVSAVLLVPDKEIWWAITFGQGRRLIRDGLTVDGFGLRVALNTLGDENIKSLDKETFDMIAGHARFQASREVGTEEFGLDIERDLLWAVTGSPSNSSFGQQLTGRDALLVSIHIDLPGLETYLPRLYPAFVDKHYQKNFAWIDNIREVDEEENQLLDMELLDRLRERNFEHTWLAPPEILEWSTVRYFSYSEASRAPQRFDIHWSTFFKDKVISPTSITIDFLKTRQIYCLGDDGVTLKHWPAYRCIYAEVKFSEDSYFLSGGKWYRIVTDFVEQVNSSISQIPVLDGFLPDYADNTEDTYNIRVGQAASGFHLMHKVLIPYGGGKSSIEFCDLLGSNGDIIHVKRFSGSRDLSHLFAQGLNSGQLFQIDAGFRRAVDPHLPPSLRGRFIEDRPAAKELQVIFAIVSKSLKPFNLPFFAKLSLRHAAQRLEIYGYRVALAKIGTEPVKAEIEVYGERKKTKPPKR